MVCPLLQRNGYAGEARAEFQEGTVRENEMDSEREGERQGERPEERHIYQGARSPPSTPGTPHYI